MEMKKVLAAVLCLLLAATVATAQAPGTAKGGSPLMDPKSPEMNKKAPDIFKAKFTTSQGDFTVEVHRAWSPNGADRFFNLVKNGFYDDCRFFRVISGFMVQFGINGDPKISAQWRPATIPDDPLVQGNKRGLVTFAKTGQPNSRTTQVFINFGDNSRLDPQGFSAFGKISDEGMKVVDKLYASYGEGAPSGGGPDQGRIQSDGNAYLKASFPKLDYVKKAVILE
jgi:peptidyl-prolyl cis-trans isomerase A (cyclophilin A)